jgi:crotonobetainyl-CoA:carnitine CoA-transferase CaiB-like acyl-CoA transferase
MTAMLPLSGIRVVEIAQNISGPFAAEILASLGADVVKVERPAGDDARAWGPKLTPDASHLFHTFNCNKRGVAVDLRDPAAIAWLKAYAAECDVVVQNLRPGVVQELGLDAPALMKANPRLIYCSVGAYGNRGPMKMQPGYEPIVQAFSGMFSVNGAPEGPPSRVGLQALDMGTGMWTAIGCVAALYRRQVTGKGCVVDSSLFETALSWLSLSLGNYRTTGTLPTRHRSGSPRIIIFRSFETKDGEIVVAAANDRLFAKFATAVGRAHWNADARYRTNDSRLQHQAELMPQIEALMRTRRSTEWIECLEAAGVPCAPINTVAEVAREPQTAAMEMLQSIPGLGEFVRMPLSFDGERPAILRQAPRIGQHNAEILPGGMQKT